MAFRSLSPTPSSHALEWTKREAFKLGLLYSDAECVRTGDNGSRDEGRASHQGAVMAPANPLPKAHSSFRVELAAQPIGDNSIA
ncbi:hypothetical protein ABIB75_007484 [Bradyrhizobium sp. GM2.2]|uniref:hypothetical protein n=1 Tax=Bradyrhizobium sp. GM2.2 TaxID=3156358 RepID=UPI003393C435